MKLEESLRMLSIMNMEDFSLQAENFLKPVKPFDWSRLFRFSMTIRLFIVAAIVRSVATWKLRKKEKKNT